MVDMLGTEIKVGYYIVYGVRSGNTGETKVGKVLELRDGKYPNIKVRGLNEWLGRYNVQRPAYISPGRAVVSNDLPQGIKDLLDG